MSEINSLRNITYPAAPVTYTPVKIQKKETCFHLTSTCHTHLTLIGFDGAQGHSLQALSSRVVKTISKSQLTPPTVWRVSTFSFCLVRKKKKKHRGMSSLPMESRGFLKLSETTKHSRKSLYPAKEYLEHVIPHKTTKCCFYLSVFVGFNKLDTTHKLALVGG